MDVSVLTVTWNSAKFILKQIDSVERSKGALVIEQLLADNGSIDDTVSLVKKTNPNLKLIDFKYNTGFGFANNRLAEQSLGDYLLLINPDIEVVDNGIERIYEFAKDHPRAGIVGGLLLNENSEIKINALPRRFPTFFDQIVIAFKLHYIFPNLLNKYLDKNQDVKTARTVDSVQGSFMLVRKELYIKLGHLFDERYFIWFEDVDLCREAKKNGFEVWFAPIKVAKDFGGKSFEKRNIFWKQYNFFKSAAIYFMKWGIR